jgi:lipoprotein signal peptidase
MKHSLAARLPIIAAIALTVAAIDWALKAWALAALRPDQLVFNADRTWHAVVILPVIGVFLIVVARTRLLALSAGMVIGGGIGNMAEKAVFGQVTDFLPLGVPYSGSAWSPADIFLICGLLLLWYGAFRYGRARRLDPDARQPLWAARLRRVQVRPGKSPG